MKLARIDLAQFGHFTGHDVALDPASCLHVVYGPNSAGKSTIAAAIEYALMGWPRTRTDPVYDGGMATAKLRVGLVLVGSDDQAFGFRRRKGNKDTVLDPETLVASDVLESRLARLLAGMDRTQWRLRHGLTKDRLNEGGRDLQASGGDLGAALVAVHDGMSVLQATLDGIEARRRALHNGARSGAIVDALTAYDKASAAMKAASDRAAHYETHVTRRDALDREHDQLGARRRQAERTLRNVEYVRTHLAQLAEWEQLGAQLAELDPRTQAWSSMLHDAWQAASHAAVELRAQLDQDEQRRDALQAQVDALSVDDGLLALYDDVDALRQRLSHVSDLRAKLPGLERDIAAARAQVEATHAALGGAAAQSSEAFSRLVDRALAHDIDAIRTRRVRAASERQALEHRAAALHGCELDVAGVRALTLPPEAELARIVARVQVIDADIAAATADHRAALEAAQDHEAALSRIEQGDTVPTIERLSELREARDAAWSHVREHVLGVREVPDAAVAIDRVDAGIRGADAHADAMTRAGARVGHVEQLARQITQEQSKAERALERRHERERERDELMDTDWQQLWSCAGIAALSVEAMADFRARVESIRADAEQLDADCARVDAELQAIAELSRELEHAAGATAQSSPPDADELTRFAALRDRASELRSTSAAARSQHDTSKERLIHSERAHREAMEVLDAFAGDVSTLQIAHDPHARPLDDVDAAVSALTGIAKAVLEARQASERRTSLVEQLAALNDVIRDRQGALAGHASTLSELRAVTGALDDDAARGIDRAWTKGEGLREQRRAIEDAVRSELDVSVQELIDARDAEPAPLDERIDAIARQIESCTNDQLAAQLQRDELVAQIKELETSTNLTDAAQARDQALAQLEQLVPELRRLAVQEHLLRDFIDTFAQQSRGPLVERAGAYFAHITGGTFTGIQVDARDDGGVVIVGLMPDSSDVVPVDQMSEGTADQLFLALRLAAVMLEHERGGEPMPLIIDDVLASFDNDRARATLELFTQMGAAGVQVIFLTHHEHLVEIVETDLSGADIEVVRISAEPREPA